MVRQGSARGLLVCQGLFGVNRRPIIGLLPVRRGPIAGTAGVHLRFIGDKIEISLNFKNCPTNGSVMAKYVFPGGIK